MSVQSHLNYKKYGEKGRVILILHGLFGMLDNWNSIARRLAENYQVYSVDQRNHGRSFHSDEMSYELKVEDLLIFLKEQELTQISLVGHSMGGKVAMHFALTHPEFIERLIVLDIAPVVYAPAHHLIFSAIESIDFSLLKTRSAIADKLGEKITQPAVIQFLMKNLGRDGQRNLEWKMNWRVIQHHYDVLNAWDIENRQFEGETLFIKGEWSDYIKDSDSEEIEKYFPNAEILSIKRAGHWVHAQQPELLLEAINRFVN